MLMPRLFGDVFDDWFGFDDFDRDMDRMMKPLYGKHGKDVMKTDVKEKDGSYEVDIDLPGFKKEDVSVKLENGYLTITASKGLDKDEENKDKSGYIRRERWSGSCSRTCCRTSPPRFCGYRTPPPPWLSWTYSRHLPRWR